MKPTYTATTKYENLCISSASGKSLRQVSMDEDIMTFDEYSMNEDPTFDEDGTGRALTFGSDRGRNRKKTLTLTIVNESFSQPFGGFLVMVHNDHIDPLYVRGQPSSSELATLAKDGNPGHLVQAYQNIRDVLSVEALTAGVPFLGGTIFQIEVEVSRSYPLVTIASMAINTNDCFVALNGVRLRKGMVLDAPGLDAGSEENNEVCASIPGPGCANLPEGNVRSLNGKGFVHIHRGFFGIGPDLPDASRYDWRNPMMRVVVH